MTGYPRVWQIFLAAALAFAATARAEDGGDLLGAFDFLKPAPVVWGLPDELDKISGLAVSDDGRLFAVQGKHATIHEIDYKQGAIVKTFSFGRPAVKGSFRGIAFAGKRLFVITEKGVLYEGREGFNGEGKVFNRIDTGFGKICRAEGLAASNGKLLVLCGKPKDDAYKGFLTVLAWDVAAKKADPEPFLKVPLDGEGASLPGLEPAGLAALDNGTLLILSADDRGIVTVTPDGQIAGFSPLDKKSHDGPAGLAFGHDGALIVADQGKHAWLSVFGVKAD